MKLHRFKVDESQNCGGLINGLEVNLRNTKNEHNKTDPICLIGPNGSGKSQFLQAIAEAFQAAMHSIFPCEERVDGNPTLLFELEYSIYSSSEQKEVNLRVSRKKNRKRIGSVSFEIQKSDGTWVKCSNETIASNKLLPDKIFGYFSGNNATFGLPFYLSKQKYAQHVASAALGKAKDGERTSLESRLTLVDYRASLGALAANLLLGKSETRKDLLESIGIRSLSSFRIVIQLGKTRKTGKREIVLSSELEDQLEHLKNCATTKDLDKDQGTYRYDYHVDEGSRTAFRNYWDSPQSLFSTFRKFSMLNDLRVAKKYRTEFLNQVKLGSFAKKCPEPPDSKLVFRFERVKFVKTNNNEVDYISLSDGEHQRTLIYGLLAMVNSGNVLFLLDEPESHFNPEWRVKFVSKLNQIQKDSALRNELIITTHAPFIPSDMDRENVIIFKKNADRVEVKKPDFQTFGSPFDSILEQCFDISPPISNFARSEIEGLMKSKDIKRIRDRLQLLGHSFEKIILIQHLKKLETETTEA